MLIVERNVTLPSENIRRQISSIVNNFIYNNIEKKSKLNNWSLDKIKSHLNNQIKKNENHIFLGNVRTKEKVTNKNLSIDIFLISDDEMSNDDALYIHNPNGNDDSYGQIQVKFSLIFGDRQIILNKIVHELIHGIQNYKEYTKEYTKITKKINLQPIDWFLYYTEQSEFETQIGELVYNIIEVFKRSKKPFTILYILKKILLLPKEKLQNIDDWANQQDPYIQEIFKDKIYFIYYILNPPQIKVEKLINTRENRFLNKRLIIRSDKCYKYFKQKLYTIYQKLKEKNK